MAKFVVEFEFHEPDDHQPNYQTIRDEIANHGSVRDLMHSTVILQADGKAPGIHSRLRSFIDSQKWNCDILVSQINMGEVVFSKTGQPHKTYTDL